MIDTVHHYGTLLIQALVHELQYHPLRALYECVFLGLLTYFIIARAHKPKETTKQKISKEVAQKNLQNFSPKPLLEFTVPATPSENIPSLALMQSAPNSKIILNGKELINFSTFNFLGFATDKKIIKKCDDAIRHYGVGSCGPRGFYGTIDVHLKLEEKMAQFLDTEGCIYYSFGFCTISSVIPAFSKKDDLLVVDDGVNFAVKVGLNLSRSKVIYFKHNDMQDLERIISEVWTNGKQQQASQRRFIVTEGVFENFGDVAPLKEIVNLKKKYFFRLILEDSFGLGILGRNGKGTANHFDIPMEQIDIYCASLENAIGSSGGICAGARIITEHQRLNGSAYCFSAAPPPYLAVAAIESVTALEQDFPPETAKSAGSSPSNPNRLQILRENATFTLSLLKKHLPSQFISFNPSNEISPSLVTPVFHLRLTNTSNVDRKQQEIILSKIADKAVLQGVSVACPIYGPKDLVNGCVPPPSIRITVSAQHSKEEIEQGVQCLVSAIHDLKSVCW